MPYYRNGNARDYIQRNPDCDRIKIVGVTILLAISGTNPLSAVRYFPGPRLPSFTKSYPWGSESGEKFVTDRTTSLLTAAEDERAHWRGRKGSTM